MVPVEYRTPLDSRKFSSTEVLIAKLTFCATGRTPSQWRRQLEGRPGGVKDSRTEEFIEDWHPAKLSLFLRLTGEVGHLDVLVEMATDELFHEMGVWPEVERFLEHGAQDAAAPPDQRIKALDALAFADIKADLERAASWLNQMELSGRGP